jgi:Xaa-Pro aminopeptidase
MSGLNLMRPVLGRTACLFFACLLGTWTPTLSAQEQIYAARRLALLDSMEDGFAVLTSDAPPGRFNKPFYYLTGIKDPGAALVLAPGAEAEEALFTESGQWDYAAGVESAQALPRNQFQGYLSRLARERPIAHASFGNLRPLQEAGRVLSLLSELKNLDGLLARMRILKDKTEIEFLRRACQITAEGLNEAFRASEAGRTEQDLADVLENAFHERGSPGSSFLQAASGPNATNVHFGATERVLEDGDIIVFDVGAWWHDYTADISRTIPANGRFTIEQREIYTVVLNSQKAAIEAMKPGARLEDVRETAQDVLIDGLYELGLVLDKEDRFQRQFFIAHGYYHFIGLDIHDVWSEYNRMPGEKVYQPGMIMTMEPGLYFPADRLDSARARLGTTEEEAPMREFLQAIRPVYERYVNIGVRIEDDVLITETGNEVLTSAVPKEIDRIEALMRGGGPR